MTATQEKRATSPGVLKCKGTHVHFLDRIGVQHEGLVQRFLGNPTTDPAASIIIAGADGPLMETSVTYHTAPMEVPNSWHHPHESHENRGGSLAEGTAGTGGQT